MCNAISKLEINMHHLRGQCNTSRPLERFWRNSVSLMDS